MAKCRQSIPPSTANLLNKRLKALGHIVVNDGPHISFIQAHTKGHSGYNNSQLPSHEVCLDLLPLAC